MKSIWPIESLPYANPLAVPNTLTTDSAYVYGDSVVNRGLKLIGKELGMSVDCKNISINLRDLTTDQIEQLLAELGDVKPTMIEGKASDARLASRLRSLS